MVKVWVKVVENHIRLWAQFRTVGCHIVWISFAFGIVYALIGPNYFDLPKDYTCFSFFYYSIVTFTTLGFGDITPTTLCTELLVMIEVILGYIMLGGLISIFGNILARRND